MTMIALQKLIPLLIKKIVSLAIVLTLFLGICGCTADIDTQLDESDVLPVTRNSGISVRELSKYGTSCYIKRGDTFLRFEELEIAPYALDGNENPDSA